MKGCGVGLIVLVAVAQACGGSSSQSCIELTTDFSRAAVSVDPNKMMADLTPDERASVCAEFTRSLNASFGTVELQCRFGSHAGNRQGMPTCQSWYDQCLQAATPDTLMYCTSAMGSFWDNCPVTIGQYQACFNDLETVMLTGVEVAPPCGQAQGGLCISSPPSCDGDVGRCDYTWFD